MTATFGNQPPAPIILIQPDDDAIRFNTCGLSAADVLAMLRRCLTGGTAVQRAGVLTAEALIPPQAAVVAPVTRRRADNDVRNAPRSASPHLDDGPQRTQSPTEEKSGKRLGRPPGRRRRSDMDDLVAAEEGRREAERAAWDKS